MTKKSIRSPNEVVYYVCSFLKYWAGLQKEEDKEALTKGATVLQQVVVQLHSHQGKNDGRAKRRAISG